MMASPNTSVLSRATVAITRPAERSGALIAEFGAAGAQPVLFPVTRIETHIDLAIMERELAELGSGWLILPSPTAIEVLLDAVRRLPDREAALCRVRPATIGKAGVSMLRAAGFEHVFAPAEPNAQSLAQTLPAAAGERALVAGSEISRPELIEGLAARAIRASLLTLYRPVSNTDELERLRAWLASPADPDRPARIVIVAAPSAADAIAFMMNEKLWSAAAWLAIGPTTSARLSEIAPAGTRLGQSESPDPAAIVRAAETLMEARA